MDDGGAVEGSPLGEGLSAVELWQRAHELARRGRWSVAITALERALEGSPSPSLRATLRSELAVAVLHHGDLVKALDLVPSLVSDYTRWNVHPDPRILTGWSVVTATPGREDPLPGGNAGSSLAAAYVQALHDLGDTRPLPGPSQVERFRVFIGSLAEARRAYERRPDADAERAHVAQVTEEFLALNVEMHHTAVADHAGIERTREHLRSFIASHGDDQDPHVEAFVAYLRRALELEVVRGG